MVLGCELLRAGAGVFLGGGRLGRAILGGQGYDVVVTFSDLRRLGMAPLAQIGSLLLL